MPQGTPYWGLLYAVPAPGVEVLVFARPCGGDRSSSSRFV